MSSTARESTLEVSVSKGALQDDFLQALHVGGGNITGIEGTLLAPIGILCGHSNVVIF